MTDNQDSAGAEKTQTRSSGGGVRKTVVSSGNNYRYGQGRQGCGTKYDTKTLETVRIVARVVLYGEQGVAGTP